MTQSPTITDHALWTRRCLGLLAGVFAFRLLYQIFILDCDLAGDETYYWDWGRRLSWGYYSKPPLIAWLMRLVGWLSGDAAWAVRVASIMFGTALLWLMFRLASAIYNARTGFITVLLLLLTPANVILNIAFTIDVPLLFCWALALLSFWQAVQQPQRWGWWCVLACALGFGSLAKQMMPVFAVMMLMFTLLSKEDRGLLRRPQLWLSIAAGLAFLLPFLQWQRQHGWITAQHMQENFVAEPLGFIGWWVQWLRFPVLQAATYSPITWVLVIAALVVGVRGWATCGRRERYLIIFSAPALLAFQLLAMRQYVNENWPAVFYLSAFVLAAGIIQQRSKWQPWLRRGLWLGGSLVAIVYIAMPVILHSSWLGHPRMERITELLGWREAGRQAGELLKTVPRPSDTFVLVLDKRQNASGMAFYIPQHPTVYRWPKEGRIESQYEVWPSAADKIGQDAFIIYPDIEKDGQNIKMPLTVFIKRAFDSVEKLGDIEGPIGNLRKRSFQVFLGKNMRRFPPPIAQQVEEMKRLGQEAALPTKYKTEEDLK